MFKRSLLAVAMAAALFALPSVAEAWSSRTTATILLRNGPGTDGRRITVIPAGATVEVYHCAGWCEVFYSGYHGYVSARYVRRYAPLSQTLDLSPVKTPRGTALYPLYVPAQQAYLASAPIRSPSAEWADWYAGRAFYFDGRYLDRPDLFFVYGR